MDNALVVEVPHPLMQQSTEDSRVLNSEIGKIGEHRTKREDE